MQDKPTTELRPQTENLVGQPPFGRWTVKSFAGYRRGGAYWTCQCGCAAQTIRDIAAYDLRSGHSQSCGCYKREQSSKTHKTHGLRQSVEYNIWNTMLQRCTNPRSQAYKDYGGRGITVCLRWQSFEAFYHDMGARPSQRHTLERKDNNDGYTETNTIWAERTEQARNKRNNHIVTFNGRTQCLAAWAEEYNIKVHTLLKRLEHGWTVENALIIPVTLSNARKGYKYKT